MSELLVPLLEDGQTSVRSSLVNDPYDPCGGLEQCRLHQHRTPSSVALPRVRHLAKPKNRFYRKQNSQIYNRNNLNLTQNFKAIERIYKISFSKPTRIGMLQIFSVLCADI